MFEAVIAMCLAAADGPCRDHLLPGYEAESSEACTALLRDQPPMLPNLDLVPRGAPVCQPMGEALAVEEVAEGVFVHKGAIEEPHSSNRGDVANLGFVVGNTGVGIIDTGTARWIGEALWRAVRAQTTLPVSYVVLTHQHPDHVLGASVLSEAGAEVVGHAALNRAMADRVDNYIESLTRSIGYPAFLGTGPVAVDLAVEEHLVLDLGGRMLSVRTWPLSHTGTDVTVTDDRTGVMFAGDLVFDRHLPALDGSLVGWRRVMARLTGEPVRGVVPGHGGPLLDWPEGGAATARYLEVLERDTRATIADGLRLGDAVDVIASEEAEDWALFEAYNKRNATVSFTELEWD